MTKQSYKIYLKDVVVTLAESKQVFNISSQTKKISVYYCKESDQVEKIIAAIEIGSIQNDIIIVAKNIDWLKTTFFSKYKIIVAGGGYVLNEEKEILMMFRRGKWDIPKGKIEKKEAIKDGSVREVEEETGVKVKKVGKKLGQTYHTYNLKGNRVLKETHWYKMKAAKAQVLVPQLDEGIEEVKWVSKKEAKKLLPEAYSSIREVFEMADV